jgi:hypothetical protein
MLHHQQSTLDVNALLIGEITRHAKRIAVAGAPEGAPEGAHDGALERAHEGVPDANILNIGVAPQAAPLPNTVEEATPGDASDPINTSITRKGARKRNGAKRKRAKNVPLTMHAPTDTDGPPEIVLQIGDNIDGTRHRMSLETDPPSNPHGNNPQGISPRETSQTQLPSTQQCPWTLPRT